MRVLWMLLLVLGFSSQAFGFGSSRKAEKVFVHDNCIASVVLEADLSRALLMDAIVQHLRGSGWQSVDFAPSLRFTPANTIAFHMKDTLLKNNGSKCEMISELVMYLSTETYNTRLSENESSSRFDCLNWQERSEVLKSLLDTIPRCEARQEAPEFRSPKVAEEVVEKQMIEIGEELKR